MHSDTCFSLSMRDDNWHQYVQHVFRKFTLAILEAEKMHLTLNNKELAEVRCGRAGDGS